MPGWKRALPAVLCCLAAAVVLWALYQFDNKYTRAAALTQDGAVYLDGAALSAGALAVPVWGWELWPDALLAPEELEETTTAPVDTWVGEHLTLSAFHPGGSPYGAATWRLRLSSGEPVQVSMLIPEAFCASAVWVDGVYLGGTGSIAPYTPRVMDAVYSFRVSEEAQVVVQTVNRTHYYGGLTYPPVVGSPAAVGRYIALRGALYGFLCFTALAVALFSAAVWLPARGRRDPAHLWFALLCLAYAARLCYPFLRAAGLPLVRPLYALEDLGAFLILYCAARLVCLLTGRGARSWVRRGLFPLGLGMCAVGAAVPLLVLPALPAFTAAYGVLVSAYELGMALTLLALAVRGAGARGGSLPLCGLGVYALSLGCSALWTGPFEPLRGAWPEEYGAFALVLCFAVLMAGRSRAMAVENALLTGRLQEEVARKTAALSAMAEERRQGLSVLLHDLKTPLAAVQGYVELVRGNGTDLDGETREKLNLILDKCRELGGRVRALQELNTKNAPQPRRERLELGELVQLVWRENGPDVEAGGADLLLELPGEPCPVWGDPGRLKSALENLVANAASYTPSGGTVTLSLDRVGEEAVLQVRDTGPGIAPEVLPRVFERGFTTRGAEGGEGLGLYQAAVVAGEYGGRAQAASPPGGGAVITLILPLGESTGE